MKKKICSMFVTLFCMIALTYGYSLTLIVVQNDGTQSEIRPTTRAVEDSLLNSFFDIGVIVSNEPIIADSADSEQVSKAIRLAAVSGFDYILNVTLQYKNKASLNPAGMLVGDIQSFQWDVFRSSNIKKIASGKFIPQTNLAKATAKKESDLAIKKMCDEIRKDVNTAIAETGRF